MSWTPEPWKCGPYTGPVPVFRLYSVTGSEGKPFICAVGGETYRQVIENRERITACVNFCQGLDTDLLNSLAQQGRLKDKHPICLVMEQGLEP